MLKSLLLVSLGVLSLSQGAWAGEFSNIPGNHLIINEGIGSSFTFYLCSATDSRNCDQLGTRSYSLQELQSKQNTLKKEGYGEGAAELLAFIGGGAVAGVAAEAGITGTAVLSEAVPALANSTIVAYIVSPIVASASVTMPALAVAGGWLTAHEVKIKNALDPMERLRAAKEIQESIVNVGALDNGNIDANAAQLDQILRSLN